MTSGRMLSLLRPGTFVLSARCSSSQPQPQPGEDITTLDLIKRRQKRGLYSHEEKVGGKTVQWNYRSELVDRYGLNRDHTYTWAAFGVIIVVGFGLFVATKTQVINNRKDQMAERDRIREELNLKGKDRHKVAVV